MAQQEYNEDSIRSLDWKEHIRLRPGMYIGKMGNGSSPDDGVYILLKEVIDNSIDEFVMGNGKTIEVSVKNNRVSVRDYGRGIPLGKVIDCVSKINTGAKYDSKVFKKSVGLNGVGTKAANALSSYFCIRSIRDGKSKFVEFEKGNVVNNEDIQENSSRKGTKVSFIPDEFEIIEPPIIVINKKYKLKLLSGSINVNPELAKLLVTLIIISKPSWLLKYIKEIKIIEIAIKKKSSLCSLIKVFLLKRLKRK